MDLLIFPLDNPELSMLKLELCYVPKNSFYTSYLLAVKEMLEKVKNSQNLSQKRFIFNKFIEKYTAVPAIWKEWRNGEAELINDAEQFIHNKNIFRNLKAEALRDFELGYDFDIEVFYYFFSNSPMRRMTFATDDYIDILKTVKEMNYFVENSQHLYATEEIENNNFDDFWKVCEEYSTMEISKSVKKQVEEIVMVAENVKGITDDSTWMEKLVHIASKECIIKFIERRIFKNPCNNIVLWRLYISYLEEQQNENIDVLNVYSRYCRLFIDDVTMRNNYYNSILKFQKNEKNVSKWLLDITKLEADFVSNHSRITLMKKILIEIFGIQLSNNLSDENTVTTFKHQIQYQEDSDVKTQLVDTVVQQIFPFPSTMIHQISTSANASVLLKLYKCCKYFYKKMKVTIIHKLSVTFLNQNFMYQNSIFLDNKNLPQQLEMNQIWLSNSLTLYSSEFIENINLSEFLLPKVYKCNIRFLNLRSQYLTATEFEYFTKSKNIESLHLRNTIIENLNGETWCLEKIIQQIPRGHTFYLSEVPCTPDTALNISALNHQSKIKKFSYTSAPEAFNPFDFSNFVMKNGSITSKIFIHFVRHSQYRRASYIWESANTLPQVFTT